LNITRPQFSRVLGGQSIAPSVPPNHRIERLPPGTTLEVQTFGGSVGIPPRAFALVPQHGVFGTLINRVELVFQPNFLGLNGKDLSGMSVALPLSTHYMFEHLPDHLKPVDGPGILLG
jgi:hypothetical protein